MVAKVIHLELFKTFKLDQMNKWYKSKTELFYKMRRKKKALEFSDTNISYSLGYKPHDSKEKTAVI